MAAGAGLVAAGPVAYRWQRNLPVACSWSNGADAARPHCVRRHGERCAWVKDEHDADGNDLELVRGLSRLLRRFALARFPRTMVAGLTGDAWLGFLDRIPDDNAFIPGQ